MGEIESMMTPIPEPVPRPIMLKFVQAEHDLMWLAENGGLDIACLTLASLRNRLDTTRKGVAKIREAD